MEIQVKSNGRKRKALAEAVGELLGVPVVYNGPPNYAFAVGDVNIDRAGNLILPDPFDEEHLHNLLDGLRQKGFDVTKPTSEPESEATQESAPEVASEPIPAPTPVPNSVPETVSKPEPETVPPMDKFVIQLPLDGFDPVSLTNLDKLVASKASLIKKALDAQALPIERGETNLLSDRSVFSAHIM